MYFSKIWFGLVTLGMAFAFALAVLAQVPSTHTVQREQAERLEHAQQSLQLLFKVNARKWMDTAARAATDRDIVAPLEQASVAADIPQAVHQTAQAKLREFNGDLKLQLLWAVDGKGRVVARVGAEETAFKDSVVGFPLVEDALRGYRVDDTWALHGKLYRVVAAPVIGKTGDKYVGALVLGEEVDQKLAIAIKERLRLDAAFILRDKLLGSTLSSPLLAEIPGLVRKNEATVVKAGWTGVVPMEKGADAFLVAAGPFTGAAAEQDAVWAILVRRAPPPGLGATFKVLTKEDFKPGRFPWFVVGGSLLLAIIVGLILMRIEADGPISRFLAMAKEFGRGDLAKLRDAAFGGKFGAIARNLNTGLEKLVRTAAPLATMGAAPRDLHSLMGTSSSVEALDDVIPHARASVPDLGLIPPSAPIVDELPPAAMASLPPLPPPASSRRPGAPPPPPPIPDEAAVLPFGPPPAAPADVFASAPPLPPPRAAAPPPPSAMPSIEARDHAPTMPYNLEPGSLTDDDAPTAISHQTFGGPPGIMSPPGAMAVPAPTAARPVVAAPPAAAPSPEGDLDAYFHQVFHEFVDMKKACGEPVDAMTFDKFVVKLRDNRQQLIEKYSCKAVRFQVYIKDGKAALKATPVK
ncbi:MAG: hypothetical protein HY906_03330 [Deltaproteobacteria bacterium]|nr:hypothetical protein [Deltaproteobacteria bacterium]